MIAMLQFLLNYDRKEICRLGFLLFGSISPGLIMITIGLDYMVNQLEYSGNEPSYETNDTIPESR